MTHDELIAYIDDSTDGLKHEHLFEKLLANTKALRAVVELHKPSPEGRYGDTPICIECSFTETGHYVSYPCRNIYTIEKELNVG